MRRSRYRGRASPRKWEQTGTGVLIVRTTARLAACHRFSPEKVVRDASEKEGGHGHRPCEETRVPERCPYVVFSCRSRQAASWPRISSHAALQKGWRYELTEA
jgi:hypothetical protein